MADLLTPIKPILRYLARAIAAEMAKALDESEPTPDKGIIEVDRDVTPGDTMQPDATSEPPLP